MKTNLLIALGLLILLGVIATALGIWYVSHTAELKTNNATTPVATPQP